VIDHIPASTWIYESPDGGDTVYRRLALSQDRELVREGPLHKLKQRSSRWRDIFEAAETDQVLQGMINDIEIYHALKHTRP
jgi:hypothetical protein